MDLRRFEALLLALERFGAFTNTFLRSLHREGDARTAFLKVDYKAEKVKGETRQGFRMNSMVFPIKSTSFGTNPMAFPSRKELQTVLSRLSTCKGADAFTHLCCH